MLDLPSLPKVDLHRHLGGSLRLQTVLEVAAEHGLPLPARTPEGLAPHAQVLAPMRDLLEVLGAFEIFQQTFVSPAVVERLAFEAVEDAARDQVRLLELRFSPEWSTRARGLDWDAAMEAILRGVRQARTKYDIAVGLVAIVSRSYGPESAERTADFALRWRSELCGFDLADDEVRFPSRLFERSVRRVREAGLPVTVHSGESTGPEHVRESLDLLGARRIGHGVAVGADPALAERVAREGVALEMCPTSNVRTRAVPAMADHPARRLLRAGVKVTLNSDDPGLFAIDLTNELRVAREELGFDDADLARATRHALDATFLPPETVDAVRRRHFGWLEAFAA